MESVIYGVKRKDQTWASAKTKKGNTWDVYSFGSYFITEDINEAYRYCDWCLSMWPENYYRVEEYGEVK